MHLLAMDVAEQLLNPPIRNGIHIHFNMLYVKVMHVALLIKQICKYVIYS